MVDREKMVQDHLALTIAKTDFRDFGEKHQGKVRDSYSRNGVRYLVATDRLSCFDRIITTIPFKGQILTSIAHHNLLLCRNVVPNHLVELPDPNVMVVKEAQVLPFEMVVRGYLAGGGWRSYQASGLVSGVKLPPGLTEFSKLPEPIITPSTKAVVGHDEPVSDEEILASGKVERRHWECAKEYAVALFRLGTDIASERGLILADTKYEFGLYQDQVILVDEVHTIDCSRYWKMESYERLQNASQPPEMLDKEVARRWLVARGFEGEGDLPFIPDEWRMEVGMHYLKSADMILGRDVRPVQGDPVSRLEEFVGRGGRASA
jgi:phosphoribosylaminoimidazole-succinocarboxamide synthase